MCLVFFYYFLKDTYQQPYQQPSSSKGVKRAINFDYVTVRKKLTIKEKEPKVGNTEETCNTSTNYKKLFGESASDSDFD